jgi:N-acyl-D-aspartate/D-glutamate deacylase
MEETAAARRRGADLRPQTAARGTAILYGLAAGRTPYDGLPSWAAIMEKPYAERHRRILDPAARGQLVAEAESAAVASGPLAPKDPARLFLLPPGEARYDVSPGNSLAALASRLGVPRSAAFLAYLEATEGRGLLYYPVLNADLSAVAAMITNPDVVLGLGDAGAHVALTMDAGQPTYMLAHWVRDEGLLTVGEAVRKLTAEGASLFGIPDRGVLRPGACADVNVIDLAALRLDAPELVRDFPLGASRHVQRAGGYQATLVNGQVVAERGELTGERPGQLVTAR